MSADKSILLLGTDPSLQELVRSCLLSRNWTVVCAASASEALCLLEQRPYDLVLTGRWTAATQDVESLRRMRRVRPHLKMVVVTEQSTPEGILAAIRAHAFAHLTEPIHLEDLREIIAKAEEESLWDDGIEVLSARPEWVSLRLKCRRLTAERLLTFAKGLRADLSEVERNEIGTAFREMLLNAIEHGGHFDPEKSVEVTRIRTPEFILYLIRDPGEGFSLDFLPQAAVSNPVGSPIEHLLYREQQGLRPGGFGILITQGLVDELLYNEQGNEVLLVKYLTGQKLRVKSRLSAGPKQTQVRDRRGRQDQDRKGESLPSKVH